MATVENNFSNYIQSKQFDVPHISTKVSSFAFQGAKPFHRVTNASIEGMDRVYGHNHGNAMVGQKAFTYTGSLGQPASHHQHKFANPFGFLSDSFPTFERTWEPKYLPMAMALKLDKKTPAEIQRDVKLSHARDPANGGEPMKEEMVPDEWAQQIIDQMGLDDFHGPALDNEVERRARKREVQFARGKLKSTPKPTTRPTRPVIVEPVSSLISASGKADRTEQLSTPSSEPMNRKQRRAHHNEEMQRMSGGGNAASAEPLANEYSSPRRTEGPSNQSRFEPLANEYSSPRRAEDPATPSFETPLTSKKSEPTSAAKRVSVFADTPQAQKLVDEIERAGKQVDNVDRKIEKEHDTGKSIEHQNKREELEEKIREAKGKLAAKQKEIDLIETYAPIRDEEWTLIQKIQKVVEQGGNVASQFVIDVNAEMTKLGYPKVSGKIQRPDSLHKAVVSSMKQFKLATIDKFFNIKQPKSESYSKSQRKAASPRHDTDGDPDDHALEVDEVSLKMDTVPHGRALKERFGHLL
jgi:hypothetical protein